MHMQTDYGLVETAQFAFGNDHLRISKFAAE